jgi:hypothetical protein
MAEGVELQNNLSARSTEQARVAKGNLSVRRCFQVDTKTVLGRPFFDRRLAEDLELPQES